jgi:hypothetical protein
MVDGDPRLLFEYTRRLAQAVDGDITDYVQRSAFGTTGYDEYGREPPACIFAQSPQVRLSRATSVARRYRASTI